MPIQRKKSSEIKLYCALLKQFLNARSLNEGKRIHEILASRGYDQEAYYGNLLISLYGMCGLVRDAEAAYAKRMAYRDLETFQYMMDVYVSCGDLTSARHFFNIVPYKGVATWNEMILAYAQRGHVEQALGVFRLMDLEGIEPNQASFVRVFDSCAVASALREGIVVAGLYGGGDIARSGRLDRDVFLGNLLVQMYGRCGSVRDAVAAFGEIAAKNSFSWNSLLVAFAQNGDFGAAEPLELFVLMDLEGFQADRVTFVVVLDACGSVGDLQTGSEIHREICCRDSLLSNAVVGTALVDLYAKCGRLEDAVLVFQQMPSRNVVSWNALVSACARNARHLDAKKVFDGMPQRDIASWNSMLAACFHGGEFRRGIELFVEMDVEGIQHDAISLVSALDACASLPDLVHGKLVVAAANAELLDGLRVGTAVLNLYGKCGCLQEARSVFERMVAFSRPSAPLWNAMIAAVAHSGESKASMELVCSMLLHGIQPDEVTLLASLTACSHAGTKFSHLHPILDDHFGAKLSQEHYTCLVDHLGRSGRMGEAEELLEAMPFKPDQVSLVALLGACGLQGDLSRGQRAFAKLGEFEDHAVTAIGCKELLHDA
ncbi:hypothetical protein SELMODRAFT_173113 [Selaginella moellendorffii]|uniref:Pentacotripeptide-repeat region of PRORP domain-containing protein n=1 Tax=Selaginella moellendorffii TaxID=88036 RepID=D8RPB7_SELML|nr:hypothetical protein SELMODRAFT_173113 [Selaginella moellendorffii]